MSTLPPARAAALSALLGGLARVITRGVQPSGATLATLLGAADLADDAEAGAELARWSAILLAARAQPTEEQRAAALEALLLRGALEVPALLAIETVTASTASSAPVPPPRFGQESLDFGELEPGSSSSLSVEVQGGPGDLLADSDLVSVDPARVDAGTHTLRVSVRAPSDGVLWASLTFRGPTGTATLPLLARTAEHVQPSLATSVITDHPAPARSGPAPLQVGEPAAPTGTKTEGNSMTDHVITQESASAEEILRLLTTAYIQASIDPDGDVETEEGFTVWIQVPKDGNVVRFLSQFRTRSTAGLQERLAYVNRVNFGLRCPRASINAERSDAPVILDHYVYIDAGIPKASLVAMLRRFHRVTQAAIDLDSENVLA